MNLMKTIYHKPEGSVTSGPYSPAVQVRSTGGTMLFVSGQGTKNPVTGERVVGAMTDQAKAAMENLRTVVEGSGFLMEEIVKVTIFLTSMEDGPAVNKVYQSYFAEGRYPARSTVAVRQLPGGQGIEIEAVAVRNGN